MKGIRVDTTPPVYAHWVTMSVFIVNFESLLGKGCGELSISAAFPITQKHSVRIALRQTGIVSLMRPASDGEFCHAGFLFE